MKTSKEIANLYFKIEALKKQINYHNQKYFNEDKPEISDFEYDLLFQELKILEKKVVNISSSSPTQQIGGNIKETLKPFSRDIAMLSLENAMNKEEVLDFIKKRKEDLLKSTKLKDFSFVLLPKFDGLALELIYIDGELLVAATRGNGKIGENITENAKQIKNIPQRISLKERIIIRGEAIMTKSNFVLYNKHRKEANLPLASNARNTVAGTLRQLNSQVVKDRNISFFAYSVANYQELLKSKDCKYKDLLSSDSGHLKLLKELNFPIEYNWKVCGENDFKFIEKYYENTLKKRLSLNYEIDGIVLKINEVLGQEWLGIVGKRPRYAIAWKLPAEIQTTKLLDIHFQIGRTGQITPVGILAPISIAGATVQRVTLHNKEEIESKDLRIGDTVKIIRSGDVIPKILKNLPEKRNGSEKVITFPSKCPKCNTILVKDEEKVLIFCPNEFCVERCYLNFVHFASKEAMNIDGMGKKIIQELIIKGKLKELADIYSLKMEDFNVLERSGSKQSSNLFKAISFSKECSLKQFIYSLGIKGIGLKNASILAFHCKTLANFRSVKFIEEIKDLNSIGETVTRNVIDFVKSKEKQLLLDKFLSNGLKIKSEKENISTDKSHKLYNKKVLFSGKMTISRNIAKEKAEEVGAINVSSISKQLDYLIIGEKVGSKLKKAKALNIKILTEEDFLLLVGR